MRYSRGILNKQLDAELQNLGAFWSRVIILGITSIQMILKAMRWTRSLGGKADRAEGPGVRPRTLQRWRLQRRGCSCMED